MAGQRHTTARRLVSQALDRLGEPGDPWHDLTDLTPAERVQLDLVNAQIIVSGAVLEEVAGSSGGITIRVGRKTVAAALGILSAGGGGAWAAVQSLL